MQVKVLYDKHTLDKNLNTGWGVSFLIDDRVILDTGDNGDRLLSNMKTLRVDFNKLEAVAISHDHWDHTGGLWEIIKRKRLKVYGCLNFSEEFKINVSQLGSKFIGVDKFTEIARDIYLTGRIYGLYKGADILEQAAVIKTINGVSVLTGCSHPGIIKILEKIKRRFPDDKLYLVAGGFHLFEQDERSIRIITQEFKKIQVIKVGPTHCTGRKVEKIFKTEYKDDFISIKVGQNIEI